MNENVVFSYSKYSTWVQCPKKYEYLYIDKLKEGPSEILEHGTNVHRQFEEYFKLDGMPIPDVTHAALRPILEKIKTLKPQVEEWWTLDADLNPCGSWDATVAWRGKIDFCYVDGTRLVIGDIKTGKVRPKNFEQLEVYAMMGFRLFPDVTEISIELYYVEHGELLQHVYPRSEAPRLELMWQIRFRPFKQATEFKPKPTALCGWCGFSNKHKQGPCSHG